MLLGLLNPFRKGNHFGRACVGGHKRVVPHRRFGFRFPNSRHSGEDEIALVENIAVEILALHRTAASAKEKPEDQRRLVWPPHLRPIST